MLYEVITKPFRRDAATRIRNANGYAGLRPSRLDGDFPVITSYSIHYTKLYELQFILYFKHDTAELTRQSHADLKKVLRTIRERNPVDISVVGHTDTLGSKNYNYGLSLKRAEAVAALLIRDGTDPSIIEITSHGKDNLLIPTGDQVSEPRNRRVEVTVR